ncbi:peptidase M1-like protein [Neolewinella xylanilytica]|uniref:Peptidase M1-like protein n=1 Tax=Neolewinella xylanilytica TaxID=1514080 RepID=A0A2S6I1X3_9BACT|nr:M1 family metallopeptidase [Neolewinella xylanilytica]PPK85175.1 peptidase M1-like protein [Neolewinella xylanilytica]
MRLLLLLLLAAPLLGQTAYFQQDVRYTIDVRLDDRRDELHGDIRIAYTNNAPEALDSIVFHLWPRAFSGAHTAFARQQLRNGETEFHFADPEARGTMDSLSFLVDGQSARFAFTREPDIGVLHLNEPLATGRTATIATPFRVKIPESFSRLGHVGQSYQITQWYPKPAVYDRRGWHGMPYLDQGEFYSEFGDFTVRITLPANYRVAATGVLQEAAERDWLLELADTTRDALANYEQVIAYGYVQEAYPPSASETKTLTYTAKRVHDFAWFADKRFQVLHDTLHPRAGAQDAVDVWSFFTRTESAYWKSSTDYLKRAVRFYSDHVGPYPYPQVTGVQSALSAGAGMEYPMITVIGLSGSAYALDEVLAHEIGHNWFYGVLGSNERDHPWMDEGLNSYYEGRYTQEFYPQHDGRIQLLPGRELAVDEVAYRYLARLGRDEAPDTRSDSLGEYNYWMGAYSKPNLVLNEVEQRVGRERLDEAFRAYYEQWRFRHPEPEDFYAALEPLGEAGYVRDAMTTVDEGAFNRLNWRPEGRTGFTLPKLSLLTDGERTRPQLFVSPLLGFNENDGALLGLALHNRTLEPRKVEFLLAPMYGFASKEVVGFAGARYRIVRPADWLRRVEISGGVQRFNDFDPPAVDGIYDYDRWALRTDFYFDHPVITERSSRLYSQLVHIDQRRPAFSGAGDLLEDARSVRYNLLRVGYRSAVEREINPARYGLQLEYRRGDPDAFISADYFRLDGEYATGYQYRPGKFLSGRLFAGYFLAHDLRERTTDPTVSFSLVDNAASDYGYDDLYLGRSQSGWYQQQLERRQGGFRAPIAAAFPYGRSNDYLAVLNLDGDLPLPVPIGIYFDAGTYGFRSTVNSDPTNQVKWVGGLSLNLLGDRFHLYLPLVADAETHNLLEQRGNLLDRLAFRLNLTGLLPWRWIDELP